MKDTACLGQHQAPTHLVVPVGFRILPIFPIGQAKATLPRFGHVQVLRAQRVWEAYACQRKADLTDDDLQRRAEADRREVDPPIQVEAARWWKAGQLGWWVKERQEWWG
jgi:hypothetical protein